MITRRESLKLLGAATGLGMLPLNSCSGESRNQGAHFSYCLNTSTIRGQNLGLVKTIEVAAEAGYDSLELWVRDIRAYLNQGNTLPELRNIMQSNSLVVENAIAFPTWMVDDPEQRERAFIEMEKDMDLLAMLECNRIAAPPAGVREEVNCLVVGERYRRLIDLGRKTGVMPHLEFWGGSRSLYNMGQSLYIAAAADDPDVHILPDVYHLFRGGSGFNSLKFLSGNLVEIFHMNDYPGDIPREEQNDSHRVYPGDGVSPMEDIILSLDQMGGTKILSLELFNPEYWTHDAYEVASTGLQRMKNLVNSVL